MLFGAMNFPVNELLQEIDLIRKMGFDYLELAMDPPMAHHLGVFSQKAQILKSLEKNGLDLVCHMPTFVSTADLSPALRRASVAEVRNSLVLAADLGAKKVVLHPSMAWGMGAFVLDKVHFHSQKFLKEIASVADSLGVTVCLENMMPRNLLGVEPQYFEQVFKDLPNLMLTLDTGHANIESGNGQRLDEFLRRFGDRIGHVHVSDNSGLRDDHWAPGEGVIDFAGFITALKKIGYDDTITFEIFDVKREKLLEGRKTIEKLLSAHMD